MEFKRRHRESKLTNKGKLDSYIKSQLDSTTFPTDSLDSQDHIYAANKPDFSFTSISQENNHSSEDYFNEESREELEQTELEQTKTAIQTLTEVGKDRFDKFIDKILQAGEILHMIDEIDRLELSASNYDEKLNGETESEVINVEPRHSIKIKNQTDQPNKPKESSSTRDKWFRKVWYYCSHPNCNYFTDTLRKIKLHFYNTHSAEKLYKCPLDNCTYETNDPSHFMRHKNLTKIHRPDLPKKKAKALVSLWNE